MPLFSECMRSCAQRMLDNADIVREGDVSIITRMKPSARRAHRREGAKGSWLVLSLVLIAVGFAVIGCAVAGAILPLMREWAGE